jgi:RNA polymerase sigma factor (sigma-70 family)
VDYKTGNNLTDHYIVEKVLRGDTNAFSAIVKATEALVAQIIFKMISNSEDRKDMAQDIYLKAFSKLSGFKFQCKLSTWIAQIAYNNCLSYIEKKKLVLPGNSYDENKTGEDALEILFSKSNPSLNNESEKIVFQKELAEIIQSEIEKLSPVYKTLISLYHQEELSYEEIAEITELPQGTVKSYLFRARKTLKDNLLAKYKKEEL